MTTRAVVLPAVLGLALSLPAASPGPVLAEDSAPASPTDAVTQARPLIDAAKAAKPVDSKDSKKFKENADPLRNAHSLLKGHTKEGFKLAAFRTAWNELASLFQYHGVKPAPEHHMTEEVHRFLAIKLAYPANRGWFYTEKFPGKDDQLWGEITKSLGEDRPARIVKIWAYRWDTTYSDIGGENAKGLAEKDLENDRMNMTKVTFRSDRVVTARLSKGFPKTSYYEVVGEDEKYGPVRRRNYYVKGKVTTLNFEVIESRRTRPEDDAWTAWQAAEETCELDAVLASFEDAPEDKKKK